MSTRADFIRTTQQRINEQCVALRDAAQHHQDWIAAGQVAELADFVSATLARLADVAEGLEAVGNARKSRQ